MFDQKETAAFVYRDRQGRVLTREPEQGGKHLPRHLSSVLFLMRQQLVSEQQGIGVNSSSTGAREITYDGNPLIVEMSGETA
ncbi:MAG TPA: hypothetical protein VIZ18_03360 [Ktedonobacteraceae bacterium]